MTTNAENSDPASGDEIERIDEHELDAVLRHYEIGILRRVIPLDRGSGKSPKVILQTDLGEFLLKKRTGTHALEHRTSAVHHLHIHLARNAFPVPSIVGTRPNGRSMTRCGESLFELAQFVRGYSYDQSPIATRAAGRMLARFHQAASTFSHGASAPDERGTYHDAARRVASLARLAHLTIARGEHDRRGAAGKTDRTLEPLLNSLVVRYRDACKRVNALGYANWPRTTVHGDWHPGNLIFRENADVAVVLDLDGTRFEPRATDIANGALQFSMRVDQSEPADWPASVDEVRLLAFCDGYDEFDEEFMLSAPEVRSLPHLMIEALIAESLGPIAATGRFGRFTGRAFLEVIERKSAWLVQHADRMTRILGD